VKKSVKKSISIIVAAMLSSITVQANAALLITEVAPWASGNAPLYATDWFELTNTGGSALNIAGWQMDDSSNGTAKVALTGITSIAAGESVIFTENPNTVAFLNTWFGASAPAGLQIGNYTGAGVGLSTAGDAVNIYNSIADGSLLQANVTFLASDALAPYQTFDNAAGLNNTAISTLSLAGVNGAFVALNDFNEIGSPGKIAAAVPEPETYAMLLAGLGFMGFSSRKRQG
jgi:Lamin Tail Domain/PEP-CTERM motif